MQQEIDYSTLLQTIEQMQKNLRVLQRAVIKLQAQQYRRRSNGTRKPSTANQGGRKSAYGMFPPGHTSMEDFRDARASWTRNLDREP